ncbi:MAG: LytR C-terminal domain-containing protein [Eubacterium sp.]|nr:LytR C-terminal domain-containing protein [Eubacterium sp.]
MAKQKKKTSTAGLFFLFFLKAVVIILGLVILAMGAYLIRFYIYQKGAETQEVADENAFEDEQEDELLTAEAVAEDELLYETDTQAATEETEVAYVAFDTPIAVINATEISGLAGAWKTRLEEAGYTNVQAGNILSEKLDESKVVMAENLGIVKGGPDGINVEIAGLDTVYSDIQDESVKVFILIGRDNNIVSGGTE